MSDTTTTAGLCNGYGDGDGNYGGGSGDGDNCYGDGDGSGQEHYVCDGNGYDDYWEDCCAYGTSYGNGYGDGRWRYDNACADGHGCGYGYGHTSIYEGECGG